MKIFQGHVGSLTEFTSIRMTGVILTAGHGVSECVCVCVILTAGHGVSVYVSASYLLQVMAYLCVSVSYLLQVMAYLCVSVSYLLQVMAYLCVSVSYLLQVMAYLCVSVSYILRVMAYLCVSVSYLLQVAAWRVVPFFFSSLSTFSFSSFLNVMSCSFSLPWQTFSSSTHFSTAFRDSLLKATKAEKQQLGLR